MRGAVEPVRSNYLDHLRPALCRIAASQRPRAPNVLLQSLAQPEHPGWAMPRAVLPQKWKIRNQRPHAARVDPSEPGPCASHHAKISSKESLSPGFPAALGFPCLSRMPMLL